MINISTVVEKILFNSPVPFIALQKDYLNLSAYAKSIAKEVEQKTKKPVRVGSIVVALSRLQATLTKAKPLLPTIRIEELSVKSNLVEITFEKTMANLRAFPAIYHDRAFASTDFFTVTQGIQEITIITNEKMKPLVLKKCAPARAKYVMDNLASLTIHLGEHYLETPNVIYALVQEFGLRRINIVEIISTLTEMSFILKQADLQESFLLMSERLR